MAVARIRADIKVELHCREMRMKAIKGGLKGKEEKMGGREEDMMGARAGGGAGTAIRVHDVLSI